MIRRLLRHRELRRRARDRAWIAYLARGRAVRAPWPVRTRLSCCVCGRR
jgi:hypothetical protein